MLINNPSKGWLTAAVPGEALGLWEAHKKFGNLPWTRLVEPAIHLASQGYAVGKNLATYLALYKDILQKDLTTRKLFFNPITNSTYNEGDVATNPKLAKVLKRIANEGVEYLYRGDVAQSAADESLAGAGIFTLNDFLEYKVKWSYALPCNLKDSNNNGFTLHMPSPPSAAIMVGMILNILQQNEVTLAEANISAGSQLAQFYHIIIEAMKHTFARKFRFGDSSSSPTSELYKYLSHHWGLKIRQLIQTSHTFSQSHYIKQAGSSKTEDLGTTNVAAIAENGDAVVASSTLNDPFGAAIIPTTLGFFLNNNMLTFTPTNDRVSTNNDSSNWIIPEKRPFTYLCPIIVLDSNKNFKLLIGAGAGGARIPTTTALMLIRYFWLNIDIKQNIEMNRFHHQLNPDIVLYESRPNNTSYDIEYLENYGHTLNTTIKKWPHVQVIVRENGENIKFTDSREYV